MKNVLFTNSIIATPLYLLSIVPFVFIASWLEIDISMGYVLLGALGWWVALLLRLPFILLIQKCINKQKDVSKYIVALSGPAEESVRLVLLLIIGLTIDNGYSLGFGWAAIEVLYGLVQLFGIVSLNQKTDKKSLEAKEMIAKMGMDKTFENSTPFWGALERFSAAAIHISSAVLLVVNPLFIICTAPLHSAVNFMVLKINKGSIMISQLMFLLISLPLFLALVIFGR